MAKSSVAIQQRPALPAPPAYELEVLSLIERGKALAEIRSQEEHERMVGFGRDVKTMEANVFDHYEPMRKNAEEGKRLVLEARDKFLGPLKRIEAAAKEFCNRWTERERQRRAREEAELLAKRRREEERARARQVKALEKAGEQEQAAAAAAAPINVAPVKLEKATVEGASSRLVWKFRITDRALIPDEWKAIDEKKIGAYGRAAKEQARIPGVEFYSVASTGFETW